MSKKSSTSMADFIKCHLIKSCKFIKYHLIKIASLNLSEESTQQREVTALTKIVNVLPCKRRTIITYDTKDTITDAHGKIEVIPCWEWLLS